MGKKSKSTKLPKRIMGVKVPKRMRKSGGRMVEVARHPFVAQIAATALIAAAAAVRDNEKVRRMAGKARKKGGELAHEASDGAASLGTVVAAKANEGARRLGAAYEAMSEGTGNGSSEKTKSK